MLDMHRKERRDACSQNLNPKHLIQDACTMQLAVCQSLQVSQVGLEDKEELCAVSYAF